MKPESYSEAIALWTTALGVGRSQSDAVAWRRRQAREAILHAAKSRALSTKFRLRGRPVEFTLNNWYGRLGNNIQQILIAILHAKAYRGRFNLPTDKLQAGKLDDLFFTLEYDFSRPHSGSYYQWSSNFFWFNEYSYRSDSFYRYHVQPGWRPRLECLLSSRYITRNIHATAVSGVSNGIIAYAGTAGIEIANDQLVIHLRAGDTQNLSQDYYATNPLFYYHWLRTFLQHAIIVTEPGPPHQLLDEIKAVFATSMVVSGSVREDFERLRQAQHLASSGAGTFAPAAAMLSTRLKTFYCSDIYLDEHLNPDMLNRGIVMVKMLKLPGYKRAWDQSKIRQDLIRTYHPYRN